MSIAEMEGPLREDEQQVIDEFVSTLEQISGDDNDTIADQDISSDAPGGLNAGLQTNDQWRRAARRLYRKLLSISGPKSDYSTPEDALNALLDTVSKNDHITEKELLNQLTKTTTSKPSNEDCTVSDGQDQNQFSEIVEPKNEHSSTESSSEDEQGMDDSISQQRRHQLLDYLITIGELLTRNGGTEMSSHDLFLQDKVTNKFQSLVESALRKLQDQWEFILNVFLPRQQLQTLILVGLVNVISVQRIFGFLPYVLCYISFVTMIYSTLAMFNSRTWLRRVENWMRLLTVFQPANKDRDTKGMGDSFYSWKSTEPYVTYFISLTLFILSLALIGNGEKGLVNLPNGWTMYALSVFFAVLCFLALADRHDGWAICGIILDIISSAPVILDKFGIRTIGPIGFVLKNWQICRFGLINIQIGLPSISVLAIVVIYGRMLLVYPRRDIYSVIVPHVVCIAWWHTSLELFAINDTRSLFESIAWYDVALTMGIIWLITFPTMAAFVVVAAVVIIQMRTVFDSISLLKTCVTATILFLPFLYRKVRQFMEKRVATSTPQRRQLRRTILALIVYGLLVFTSAALLFESKFQTDTSGRSLAKDLTWTHYEKYCSYGDENLGNRLRQQIACSQLGGKVVNWKGTVQGVRIVKIENIFDTILSYLPGELARRLRCFYGDQRNETSTSGTVIQGLDIDCTLEKYNVYTFEIDVAGPWGQHTFSSAKGAVVLIASSAFHELVTEFEQGDVVEFKAKFMAESLLKYPPKLRLIELRCLACQRTIFEQSGARYAASYSDSLWTKVFNACRYLFNFIFSPLFVVDGF